MSNPWSKFLALLAAVLVVNPAVSPAASAAASPTAGNSAEESDFLDRVRRLTYEGRRAGEGYFSPDGKELVFQSEREPGNPFYQIYLMSLETGKTELVSPGNGKTTCAFIRPGSGDILFGSTHHDPESERWQKEELELRASGKERRYAWDYDPEMDLYAKSREDGVLTRLTHERGYDAEASYSPDGQWVVFSSTRDAYRDGLTPEDEQLLEVNPSFFGEIYRMRADGSGVERLTQVPGYDGGPFYTPDGKRIVWRRFDEEGLIADIWTMAADGSDARQITDFESMSWAPYAHPSGDYILFASNKLGFSNFEIFLVDTDGEREPVRVTYSDGFDGLPVPSPDGSQLVWTSNRHQGQSSERGGQLFIGRWNHQGALDALAQSPLRARRK